MDSTAMSPSLKTVVFGLVNLMRPKQWIKNGFVLAPLVFTGTFVDPVMVSKAIAALILFCIASSATYIVNDYRDIEQDRKHPLKSKKRPLASGQVSKPQALTLLGFLYAALLAGFFLFSEVIGVIVGYLILNLAYSFVLKHQPVLDIFTIAIGFVLRVYAGASALDVPVSSWMFVTTLCLALFLASIKRRQELLATGDDSRKVLKNYSITLIDRYAEMSSVGALLFYSLFVMSARPELIMTIPFVMFGLFRYWYLTEQIGSGESPTDTLTSDGQLLLTVVCWVAFCGWAMWPEGM